ncbi:hypothetical protein EYF80_025741 [Liparis tanakae]|uniref:Uncharacterized protein n=1 Tax=Liparis tanakae TaxID=230148 RepID=A0A4Z2HDQ4_9TELE|nr:hypothetical protein EYF80_025741 [Liparis tanakae]
MESTVAIQARGTVWLNDRGSNREVERIGGWDEETERKRHKESSRLPHPPSLHSRSTTRENTDRREPVDHLLRLSPWGGVSGREAGGDELMVSFVRKLL